MNMIESQAEKEKFVELVSLNNGEPTTTSRKIAEVFGKRHTEVLRKIDELIVEIDADAILRSLKFAVKSEYFDAQGKPRPEYILNRDGFTLLAMSFTGSAALKWKLKYIAAFNAMEKELQRRAAPVNDDRLEIAKLIVKASPHNLHSLRELYPEYFTPEVDALAPYCGYSGSYLQWVNDCSVTVDHIVAVPTANLFDDYSGYCKANDLPQMGKKMFYRALINDFNLIRRQRTDGRRYFAEV